MTAIVTSPADYVYRMVRTLAQLGDEEVRRTLEERIVPLLLEWNAMSFLPPPELLVLYDRFLVDPEDPGGAPPAIRSPLYDYFSLEAQDAEGVPIASLLHEETRGLSRRKVRQAVRARGLAILCPAPRLPGSYVGNPADVRAQIRDVGSVEGSLRVPGEEVAFHAQLDLDWMSLQARSWKTQEVREFLFSRLRPRRLKLEAVRGGVAQAVGGLVSALRGVIEARGAKIESLDAMVEAVRAHACGALGAAVLRRVRPVVALHDPPWALQELPVGGYSDISTKGPFDRLLISNLAYPEEEFLRRVAEGELLFYELEAPPARRPPRKYVLLDHSPPTWGIPRLAAGAAALSLADEARERGAELRVCAAGRFERPFEDLDRLHGVHALLDHQRWERDLVPDLLRLAAVVREESADHPAGADVFLCTEAGRLEELREGLATAGFGPGARVHVLSCDARDAGVTLWRLEGGALVPAAALSLSPKDLLPAEAAPPRPRAGPAIHPAFPEHNSDFGPSVTCAAVGPGGLALTGHADGEVRAWDAGRGTALGLRWKLGRKVSSIMVNGPDAVMATDGPVFLDGREASIVHGSRDGRLAAVDSRLDPRESNGIRAGWREGQFFWFDREGVLVEYHAVERRLSFHGACRKTPGAPFLVDAGAREVLWTDLRGVASGFDLSRVRDASDSPLLPQLARVGAKSVADPEGRAVARLEGHDTLVEGPSPVVRFPNAQKPLALSRAARRLVCANSNALWFWALEDRSLVRKNVSPSQEVTDVCLGNVAGFAQAGPAGALRLSGRLGSPILLRWATEGTHRGVHVDHFNDRQGEDYFCGLDGTKEHFVPARLWPGNGISDLRKGLRIGGLVVVLANERLVEFRSAEDDRPVVRFWFRLRPLLWAMASADAAWGPSASEIVAPGGAALARDPGPLAAALAAGMRWNG